MTQLHPIQEPIDELNVVGQAERLDLIDQALAVRFALMAEESGVGCSKDHIPSARDGGHHRRHRLDRDFVALAVAEQAEAQDHRVAAKPKARLHRFRIDQRQVVHPMRDHVDPARIDPVGPGQQRGRGARHDDRRCGRADQLD